MCMEFMSTIHWFEGMGNDDEVVMEMRKVAERDEMK